MIPVPYASLLLAAVLGAVSCAAATGQEAYRDRHGVWRYVEPPVWNDGPSAVTPPSLEGPTVWRGVRRQGDDPGMHLRGVVPSYDEPPPDLGLDYGTDYGAGDPLGSDEGYAQPGIVEPGRARAVLRGEGYFDEPSLESGREFGLPQLGRQPQDWRGSQDPFGAPGGVDLAGGLARYAAAKRAALGLDDPAKRLRAIQSANAYLVTLALGPISTDAIRGLDILLGLGPVTKTSTQLPGAGTEVVTPDRKPSDKDRDAAMRVVEFGQLRNTADPAAAAFKAPGGEALDSAAVTALDGFLGVDNGRFASVAR